MENPEHIFDFLRKLSDHNNRDWFEANRSEFERAKASAESLVKRCIDYLSAVSPMENTDAKKCMFRIYRDVRFSKNKDPYKRNFSALLANGGRKSGSVEAWYLHLEPGNCFMASGVYEPDASQLARIRQEIEYHSTEFRAILADKDIRTKFGNLQGNQLKSSPRQYPKDHPDVDLLRFTQFYLMTKYRDEEILMPDFPERFADDCRMTLPFLHFLGRALD